MIAKHTREFYSLSEPTLSGALIPTVLGEHLICIASHILHSFNCGPAVEHISASKPLAFYIISYVAMPALRNFRFHRTADIELHGGYLGFVQFRAKL